MPLYEYECETCGFRFEQIQRFSDPPTERCTSCGGPVHKLLSAPAIHFKGTGWYVTDYAGTKSDGSPRSTTGAGGSSNAPPAADAGGGKSPGSDAAHAGSGKSPGSEATHGGGDKSPGGDSTASSPAPKKD